MTNMSNVGIRAYAGTSDRDRLLEIWLAASRVGHPFLGEADLSAQMRLVRDTYLPQAENWVAVVEGQPAGFIGLLDNFIGGLFVDPAFHGRGLGKRLVLHAAQLKGALDVEVYADNRDACRFYSRLGFEETARRARDDEGRPLIVVRMRRR